MRWSGDDGQIALKLEGQLLGILLKDLQGDGSDGNPQVVDFKNLHASSFLWQCVRPIQHSNIHARLFALSF